ncbi:ARM repeat-containing protein [Testicularia cyperi]|uniref:ARM repeat-containing protein n=1 Tax=Testicularia cyperi TaxID=1882483 RepID=A0A317XGX5_9BASI|nr:ARM repeat-containing protein [Testicularia cyperi]
MEQQLVACLESTLSPDSGVRTGAEAQLESLRSPNHDPQGQLGLALVHLLLSCDLAIHIRQSAGLALRKFITHRWSPYFESFLGAPAVDAEVKTQIRQALLSGLSDPIRKIRLATSYAISTIAGPDYPDQYPDLLASIQHLIEQGQPDGIHGAMALLSDFVRVEMDENQLMQVANSILPVLHQLVIDPQRHSASIRARCVLVFRQCLTTLYMVKESYPQAVKQASQTMLPQWLSAMHDVLQVDAAQDLAASTSFSSSSSSTSSSSSAGWQSLYLRNEIFKTLKVAALFRPQFKPLLAGFVHASVSNLTQLMPAFQQIYLSNSSDADPPSPDEGDDDVACDISSLACSILDFISEASRGDRCRDLFVQGGTGGQGAETELFGQLTGLLLVYSGMTTDDEENWANDANAFIADEDDETMTYSLRIAAADLLGLLIDDFPLPTLRCLGSGMQTILQQAHEARARADGDWWKAPEGVLASIGNNADAILEIVESQAEAERALNLESIFSSVVLPNVGTDAPPFLLGRGFVFASQFASALPAELAVQFLEAAVATIEDEAQSMPVKISAVRTVKNFYRHLPTATVGPFVPRIVQRLGPLLTQASDDTLILLVETVQAVVVEEQGSGVGATAASADGTVPAIVDPSIIGEIVQAALQAWSQNARDIFLLSVVSDLLESLAGSKQQGVPAVVVQRSMPLLAAAIGTGTGTGGGEGDEASPSALAETAVELSKSVLDGADPSALRGVVAILCPNLVHVLSTSDDRDVLQNGIECLTVLVKKCCDELLAWRDTRRGGSITAVDAMLQIVARLLAPTSDSESGGLAVGDLVVALLRKASEQMAPVLPQLLGAMVQRLETAQTATFSQSLILPIAYLMHEHDQQARQVMDLLESMQLSAGGPSEAAGGTGAGANGLEVLARKWVENAETFQGFWAQRISALGLTKLLDSRRGILTSVIVKGDILPDDSGIIRTRSRARTMPHKYTQVPLFAKILKVLLKEWESATRGPPNPDGSGGAGGATAFGSRDGARTPETDDEDGEWDDDDDDDDGRGMSSAGKRDEFGFLSDMLGPGGLEALQTGDDDDDLFGLTDDNDDDLKADPVYNMDFKSHLASYIRQLSQHLGQGQLAAQLADQLNTDEKAALQVILR